MSQIVWNNCIIPGPEVEEKPFTSKYYGNSLIIPRTRSLAIEERSAPLPDRKAYRSMSRAAVLLSMACLESLPYIQPILDRDPFSIGLYCAMENGPVDLKSAAEMVGITREEYAEQYRKSRNPKMFLMQLPNLAAAQAGIFLGIMGPLNVYNSSTFGSLHALNQAESDLETGRIDAALVCSAFSFENPLILERIRRRNLNDRVLCESAAAMLLRAGETRINWTKENFDDTRAYYGISHQLVTSIIKRK
ncbi:beta-ketoacyl synthase N-terminal-like domain-containing protein [Chlorobium limicola]|uniref:Beta-ketoacyl synthase-like N-terminal domain-containing protein n=1 Tax=Chlorobium limicola TaxID=1092 RepID=A0A101JTP4_CHLLI|nr:beta-ketoacyl synthase N-terminal-like domain-containing protein [Chlorobium limicola]KUL32850.1 hypothetical protein ASB62_01080 [Chlorobium limicola]